MKREELVNEITMENMKHILPVIRKAPATMAAIQSKLTTDKDANNEMIINEIKNVINSASEECFGKEDFVYTLIKVFDGK